MRYRLASLLAIGVCAMTVAGHNSLAAIAEWVRRADPETLRRLGLPFHPLTGRYRCPDERTLRDAYAQVDASALTTAGFARLVTLTGPAPAPHAPDGVSEREQRRREHAARQHPAFVPRRKAYAVDGKCLRGARRLDGSRVFVLSAVRHTDALTAALREIGAKTNEVRHEALCRIPRIVRRNSEGHSWVRWLTWIRKVKGTRACHKYRRLCPDARGDAPGDPRDTAKAILPESQSPVMQVFIHRKRRLKPVPCSASGYFVTGVPSGVRAMPNEGIQGDEWGA